MDIARFFLVSPDGSSLYIYSNSSGMEWKVWKVVERKLWLKRRRPVGVCMLRTNEQMNVKSNELMPAAVPSLWKTTTTERCKYCTIYTYYTTVVHKRLSPLILIPSQPPSRKETTQIRIVKTNGSTSRYKGEEYSPPSTPRQSSHFDQHQTNTHRDTPRSRVRTL